MNLAPDWEAFGSENLSQPEVRANVALGHAFSSPHMGPWLRQKLGLPDESLVLSARCLTTNARPDLAVFVEGKLTAVIECELDERAETQGQRFDAEFGVPVLWVLGKRREPEDLLWTEICEEALHAAQTAQPSAQGTLLTLAAVIQASLGELKPTRVRCAPQLDYLESTWCGGAFVSLFRLVDAGKLVNLPFDARSLSIRLLASPPVRPGLREGLSLLSLKGSNPRFVSLIGPANLRTYLMGCTRWVDLYEAALSEMVSDWGTRMGRNGRLLMSDIEVAEKPGPLHDAYEAFARELVGGVEQ
jgi:hypothetical protein